MRLSCGRAETFPVWFESLSLHNSCRGYYSCSTMFRSLVFECTAGYVGLCDYLFIKPVIAVRVSVCVCVGGSFWKRGRTTVQPTSCCAHTENILSTVGPAVLPPLWGVSAETGASRSYAISGKHQFVAGYHVASAGCRVTPLSWGDAADLHSVVTVTGWRLQGELRNYSSERESSHFCKFLPES